MQNQAQQGPTACRNVVQRETIQRHLETKTKLCPKLRETYNYETPTLSLQRAHKHVSPLLFVHKAQ